jgi:hypothetical protein
LSYLFHRELSAFVRRSPCLNKKSSSTLLKKLIRIGDSPKLERIDEILLPEKKRRLRYIPEETEYFLEAIEHLDTRDMAALIKCLTVAERTVEGWNAGSASLIVQLLRRLCETDPDVYLLTIDWVFANTDNSYLPFGQPRDPGARSLDEYHALEEEYWALEETAGHYLEMVRINREINELEMCLAKERKANRATIHLPNAIRREDMKAIKALIDKGADVKASDLQGLTPLDLAKEKGNQEIINSLVGAEEKCGAEDSIGPTVFLDAVNELWRRSKEIPLYGSCLKPRLARVYSLIKAYMKEQEREMSNDTAL